MLDQRALNYIGKQGAKLIDAPEGHHRFIVQMPDGKYAFGRVHSNGSVKIAKSRYTEVPTLEPLPVAKPQGALTLRQIKAALIEHRAVVASHMYGAAFAVGKVSPLRGWRYYTARITAKGVEIDPVAYHDRGAALVHVNREGGTTVTQELDSLPSRPLNLYS